MENVMAHEYYTSSNQWEEWNTQGFIPGPQETESDFVKRVAFCQNLEKHLVEQVGTQLPFAIDHHSSHVLDEALPLTQELYGIRPQWVPLFFNNYQLAPWHGGCAWIFQLNEESPTASFLQLRAPFRSSPTYLGLYQRRELIAHELAHVGRMLYQEPQFEELLAYQSSSSKWRRWLGPIVQSSKETLFFILILAGVILADFALLSVHSEFAMKLAGWIEFIPLILIAFALGRLIYRHQLYKKCLRNLEALYPHSKLSHHLLYRLQDEEIKLFAHQSPSQIREFMEKARNTSFRWLFLKTLYEPIPIF
jgi:hypothetical protein